MPKGALLHCHTDALVDMRTVLNIALKQKNIHIAILKKFPAVESITKCHTLDLPLPRFTTFNRGDTPCETVSVTDDNYQRGDWIPIQTARGNFPSHLGGPEGFDEWICKALTIDPTEAYETHSTVTKANIPSAC
jgi:adenosine deaminase CECR1